SAFLVNTSLALPRVGSTFCTRFGPLMRSQILVAVSIACSSVRSAYRWKYESGWLKAPERSSMKRLTYQLRTDWRSEEHTSELQSRFDLVCRLLLEKKKTQKIDLVADHGTVS